MANNAPPRHIVAVGGLVTNQQDNRVLLIRSPHRGWEFPGGQVEEGESLPDALVREVREETGLDIAVGRLAGVYSNIHSKIVMFGFVCEWTGGGAPTVSEESLEVEWVSREDALMRVTRAPLHDRLRDMIEFDGRVIYRSYEFEAISSGGGSGSESLRYVVREERRI